MDKRGSGRLFPLVPLISYPLEWSKTRRWRKIKLDITLKGWHTKRRAPYDQSRGKFCRQVWKWVAESFNRFSKFILLKAGCGKSRTICLPRNNRIKLIFPLDNLW